MPERQAVKRYNAEEVQGKDSYVITSQVLVEEMRQARDTKRKADKEGTEWDAFELGLDVIKKHVLEWNWVDNDGNPLPQIPDDPTVVEKLTDPEIGFLSVCIQGSETDAKN